MNAAQKRAVEDHLSYLEDNLYRYKMAEGHTPGSKTGNGKPFTEIIAEHKSAIAELKEGLTDSERLEG